MSDETVELPWLDEPVELSEAVEAIGRASQEDSERIDALEDRTETLTNASGVTCPSCGESDEVLKASVAAAQFVREGSLSETNVQALNQNSHVCLACEQSFTPD